jgi:DNA-directed RNA polymerase specialized sigma24 family protein
MWLDVPTRTFVRNRVRVELYRYHTGNQNLHEELEMDCWEKVATHIDQYRDLGLKRGAWAWLKHIVFSTVTDHFKVAYRRNEIAPMEPLILDDKLTPDDHDRRLAVGFCPAAPTPAAPNGNP